MAYHTTLKTSKDYYEALRAARRVSDGISNMLKENLGSSAVEVFPYRYVVSFVTMHYAIALLNHLFIIITFKIAVALTR